MSIRKKGILRPFNEQRKGRRFGERFFWPLNVTVHPETFDTVPCFVTDKGPMVIEDGDELDLLLGPEGESLGRPEQPQWIHVEARKLPDGWHFVMPMQHQACPGDQGYVGEGWVAGGGRTMS